MKWKGGTVTWLWKHEYARIEVLTAVVMNSSLFWYITACSPLKVNWRFGGTCRLHLQGRKINKARNQHWVASRALAWHILLPWRCRRRVLLKRLLNFSGLHCVMNCDVCGRKWSWCILSCIQIFSWTEETVTYTSVTLAGCPTCH
jgi:hypothetical protein